MSRFNNPKALLNRPEDSQRTSRPDVPPKPKPVAPRAERVPLILEPPSSETSIGQRLGFALLCIFCLSGYANDFAVQSLGAKAYISTVSFAALPIMLVLSGNLLRGLRDITGRIWLLFIIWVCLAVPFSVWKGGSVGLLLAYVPHNWIQLYYFAAFAISVKHCRQVMFFLIAGDFLLLLDCFFFGSMTTGRLDIPHSMFFNNANDLALQLTIAITQFMYLLYQRQVWKHIVACVAMLAAAVYLLKTGSRGDFLAVLILAVVCFVFAKQQQRLRFIVVGIPVLVGALLLVPSESLHRLMLIVVQPDAAAIATAADASSMDSQAERVVLLKTSVQFALTHPLFGVGPGQFAVAMSGDMAKDGKAAPWLGTHNSYTQVASECGIPAFVLYTSVVIITMVSTFRIYRRTVNSPALQDVNALAFCVFCGAFMYAICTLFFHIAYTGILPTIAGMSVALRLSTNAALWGPAALTRPSILSRGAGLSPAGLNKGVAPAR
jgi:hypothetical protein